ncbi:hypothetical protein ACFL0H_13355 [Thermodesulfobacteriota bacterium]
MKAFRRLFNWFCILSVVCLSFAGEISANTLYKSRQIHLSSDGNRIFRIGITGTTAGYNYLALIEDAKQESISLGDLGYWELVPDPPSFLRNYDLQLIVKNNHKGNFQIVFEYNRKNRNINYRIKEGTILVKLDNSSYYPTLVIDSAELPPKSGDKSIIKRDLDKLILFDFNSFDADLRIYYGSIKRLLKDSGSSHYFYYYEADNYNSYYFKTYKDVAKLDTDKMGLSLEDGSIEYYQKVIDNLKFRFGPSFASEVIIVSRFGNRFSKELKKYAHEIGLSREMAITFWSYDDIQ